MVEEKTLSEISRQIRDYSAKIKFGVISVSLKYHEGNCCAITYEITETTKHKEKIHE
jgi:hypothetical protein